MAHDIDVDLLSSQGGPAVQQLLHVPLHPSAKVFEHGRAPAEDDVAVEWPPGVNTARLDSTVDHLRQHRLAVLLAEEHLQAEETLALHTECELFSRLRVDHCVLPVVLSRVLLGLPQFLVHVRAHVAVLLLHLLGCLHAQLWWDGLPSLTEQLLHLGRHTGARNWHAADTGAGNVAVHDRNHMSDAVPRVHHSPS
eukprot:CAMPEP_0117677720 /NCGR_PEP_ID=MMETSP0804-20121206/16895_1 /TAXON_ID=1074897 /ORGANISM="Tetraselmis astigmatica, Strain CCMP880" /LENGTH=194 /DNA_ID=CAMNT_0005487021 /DNA_START=468 /DNA_END=1052 /DNA_ORIENTATION=+